MDVSIGIITWNARALLEQLLRSIYASVKEVSFEIIEKLMAAFGDGKTRAGDSENDSDIKDKFNVEFTFFGDVFEEILSKVEKEIEEIRTLKEDKKFFGLF